MASSSTLSANRIIRMFISVRSLGSWNRYKCTSCTWLPFLIGQVCSQMRCRPYMATNFGFLELRTFPSSPSKVKLGTFYPFTLKAGSASTLRLYLRLGLYCEANNCLLHFPRHYTGYHLYPNLPQPVNHVSSRSAGKAASQCSAPYIELLLHQFKFCSHLQSGCLIHFPDSFSNKCLIYNY